MIFGNPFLNTGGKNERKKGRRNERKEEGKENGRMNERKEEGKKGR